MKSTTATKTQILDLAQDVGAQGWSWFIRRGDRTDEYRTNSAGEGLFRMTTNGGIQQIDGTCQFALVPDRTSTRRIIRRRFNV